MPATIATATAGCRRAHLTVRSVRPARRAVTGSPRRNRPRSAASSAADGYRRICSFRRHLRQTFSRSRGTRGLSLAGATGSSTSNCRSVSAADSPRNGGRPVSASYKIAPSAYTSAAGPTAPNRGDACSGAM